MSCSWKGIRTYSSDIKKKNVSKAVFKKILLEFFGYKNQTSSKIAKGIF